MPNLIPVGSNGLITISRDELLARVDDTRAMMIATDTAIGGVKTLTTAGDASTLNAAKAYTETKTTEARWHADELAAQLAEDIASSAGESAYDLWLQQGNTGTLLDFLNSLESTVPGPAGEDAGPVPVGAGTLVPLPGAEGIYVPGAGAELVWSNSAGRTATALNPLNGIQQRIYGDTGERDIRPLAPEATAGFITVSRNMNSVTLSFTDLALGTLSGQQEVAVVPSGFRPYGWQHFGTSPHAGGLSRGIIAKGNGIIRFYGLTPGQLLYGTFTYKTMDPWPTSLPGTARGSIPE